jgi:uncharacterized protein (DUF2235 family)
MSTGHERYPLIEKATSTMKHIVICCDGTGNEYGDANSNVVKLYRALARDAGQLATYYHPGVGTMGAKNALSEAGKVWTQFRGLAFGYGLSENIADAYRYLMQTFEPDDRIFIFGFSRGAYTARALCGMLEMFGLLAPGVEGQIPYAMRLFKRRDGGILSGLRARSSKFAIARGFKSTFCRECKPHFLGLWDTVSSVGWILDPIGLKPGGLPYTFSLGDVSIVRHALAIDERRAFFRQNMAQDRSARDIKQVWFAGVHSDVGGSYPEAESGLSKISLSWMFREAQQAGLLFDASTVARTLGGDLAHAKPLPNAVMHNSLTPLWWLAEFWPKFTKRRVSQPGVEPERFKGHPRLNLFRRRHIPDGARIHESVLTRKAMLPRYAPSNLPQEFTREPDPDTAPYPTRLKPGDTARVGVFARAKWNNTTIEVRKGETYRFEATGTWYDASIPSGPSGYMSPSFGFRLVERLRRRPHDNWFALIGAVGQDRSAAFLVGAASETTIFNDGVLYCYANDLPFLYGNNSGTLKLQVTRLA